MKTSVLLFKCVWWVIHFLYVIYKRYIIPYLRCEEHSIWERCSQSRMWNILMCDLPTFPFCLFGCWCAFVMARTGIPNLRVEGVCGGRECMSVRMWLGWAQGSEFKFPCSTKCTVVHLSSEVGFRTLQYLFLSWTFRLFLLLV